MTSRNGKTTEQYISWNEPEQKYRVDIPFGPQSVFLGLFPEPLFQMAVDCRNEAKRARTMGKLIDLRNKYKELKKQVKAGAAYQPLDGGPAESLGAGGGIDMPDSPERDPEHINEAGDYEFTEEERRTALRELNTDIPEEADSALGDDDEPIDMDQLLDALRDGHPNPEGAVEWAEAHNARIEARRKHAPNQFEADKAEQQRRQLERLMERAQEAEQRAQQLRLQLEHMNKAIDAAERDALEAWNEYSLCLQRIAGKSPSFKASALGALLR